MSSPARVSSLGRFARAALVSGEARVIAVFERSCYVEAPAGLACIGAVGNGPLNALCDFLPAGLAVGAELRIDIAGAWAWSPRKAPAGDAAIADASLERLRILAARHIPSEGFGYLLDPSRERPLAVEALAGWLAHPAGVPVGAAGLVGLGPGLTPSGDDLIGGALCALHATGRSAVATRLAAWALPLAQSATNRISCAHLACAAEGECGEAVNDAIVALVAGGEVDLGRIGAIGHTSGWDALAGAVLALRALAPR
ncbi:MAG: DUF2877 domain-containing protein [Proteobacteria bacterium]|nr:DUF2877 domain-containing protein [Pseudomonadota bacterium]